MNMPAYETFYHQEILDALRVRICTTPPAETFRLRENDLAAEFDISRSPIRQVLQILARQHLIIIKPSVGASVTQLSLSGRAHCFRVYQDILAIGRTVAVEGDVPQRVQVELAAASGIVTKIPEITPEIYVTALVKMHTALATLIGDQIIQDAQLSAVFRMLRWRVEAIRADPAELTEQVRAHLDHISQASRNNTVAGLLGTLTEVSRQVVKESDAHRSVGGDAESA